MGLWTKLIFPVTTPLAYRFHYKHMFRIVFITHSIVLLKSSSIFLLFLVSWGLGLVAIYLHEETYGAYLQYPFAIFYAALGVVVFVILCVNKDVSPLYNQ